MAVGTGLGIDVSKLEKELNKLDRTFDSIISKGEKARDAIEQMLTGPKANDVIDKINKLKQSVVELSSIKDPMKWDSKGLTSYINNVNRLIRSMEQINAVNGGKAPLIDTSEIEAARNGLKKLLTEVKALEKEQKSKTTSGNQTYSGSLKFSDNANTIEKERQAIINLQVARDKLKQTDADYATKLNTLNEAIAKHELHIKDSLKTDRQKTEEIRKQAEEQAKLDSIRRKKNYDSYVTTYEGALRTSDKAKSINDEEKAIKNLEAARARLSQTDADYAAKLTTLNAAIDRHKESIRAATEAVSKSPSELISMKGSANTLNELKKYADDIRRTMATLNPKSNEWKQLNTILQQTNGQISGIENKMKGFSAQTSRATAAAGGLARAIASAFSVYRIIQYVKQLVTVTGEFEQMHVALNVITGDLEASNRIWDQTVELAKKSPFKTMELVKYTRQLAAYRIETDKLHKTTKMLADVSAGLGVDMSRLILAYGQVRAAEYLRGTELRQFTEAGVPMLDELAKHFTELNGTAVTTAEVFEMISKRQVAFADVSAVLENMTSEGGPFYKMQEQMANTLKGSVAKLGDEINLMMADIGNSNSGIIKGFVSLLRSLARNWETIANVVKVVTALYIGYNIAAVAAAAKTVGFIGALKGATMASGIFTAALGALTRAIATMSAAFMASPIGWIALALSAIVGVIWAVNDASNKAAEEEKRRAEELKESLDKINEAYDSMGRRADEFYKKLTDPSSSFTEAQIAILKLIDILKEEYHMSITVDLEGASKEEIQEIGEELNRQRINLETDAKSLLSEWESKYKKMEIRYSRFMYESPYEFNDEDRPEIGNYTRRRPDRSLGERGNYYMVEYEGYKDDFNSAMNELIDFYNTSKTQMLKVVGQKSDEFVKGLKIANVDSAEKLKQHMNTLGPLEFMELYYSQIQEKGKESMRHTIASMIPVVRDQIQEIANSMVKYEGFVSDEANIGNAIQSALNYMISEKEIDQQLVNTFKSSFEKALGKPLEIAQDSLLKWQEDYNKFLEEDIGSVELSGKFSAEFIKKLDGKYKNGETKAKFLDFIAPGETITKEELAKRVKEELDKWKHIKEAYENALAQGLKSMYDKETYEFALLAIDKISDANVYVGNVDKKGTSKAEEKNKKRIELLKKMNTQYLNEFKTFGKEAESEIRAAYEKAFGEIFKGTKIDFSTIDFTSASGMVESLEKLMPLAKKAGKDAVEALETEIAKFKGEIKIDDRKKLYKETLDDIQEYFDRYELSVELKKLNISKEQASKLFGLEYLDVDELRKKTVDEFVGDVSDKGKAKQLSEMLSKKFGDIDWSIVDEILGPDQGKEVKKRLEDINNFVLKNSQEEAKEFVKFLKNNLDEIKTLQDKGAYNIALADKLYGEGKITAEEYNASIKRIIAETNEAVSKVNLEKFKESKEYIQAMGDLTSYSASELRTLIKTLEDVVAANSNAFSADEAKEYINAIYNAQSRLDELEKNPFRWESFAVIGDIFDAQKDINAAKAEKARLDEQEQQQLTALVRLEEQLVALEAKKAEILSGSLSEQEKTKQVAAIQSQISNITTEIQNGNRAVIATQNQAKTTEATIGKLGDKMKSLLGNAGGAGSAGATIAIIDAIINGINDTVQGVLDLTNEIGSVMESFGLETDMSTGFGKFQKGFSIFAESSQHAADGWNALKSGDPVGAVVSVVKSVTSIIRGINEYKDAKFEVTIQDQIKEVEKLGKKYEDLEKQAEKAYSISAIKQNSEALKENIDLQIQAYRTMIAAETDKKNTDTDKIDEWNDSIKELEEQWESLKNEMLGGIGGISEENFRSQTRAFVDSWVSAFKDTGDGLSGLQDNFEEFFDNIIAEQATLKITDALLKPLYDNLNEYLKDFELTSEESKSLRAQADAIMPELSAALEQIWTSLGGSNGSTTGKLSELQKGIQGVTEETAQVLEALLNSMRLYVADTNNEIRSQTEYIRKMYKFMEDSVSGLAPFYVQMHTI